MTTRAICPIETRFFWFFLACSFSCVTVHAHGVSAMELDASICVEFVYDDQSPLSYCDVTVFEPGKPDSPILEGTTDLKGRFLFYPDKPGTWTLKISDGMGHGMIHKMAIPDTGMEKREPADPRMPRGQKIIIGLAFIFGLTGVGTFAASIREKRRV